MRRLLSLIIAFFVFGVPVSAQTKVFGLPSPSFCLSHTVGVLTALWDPATTAGVSGYEVRLTQPGVSTQITDVGLALAYTYGAMAPGNYCVVVAAYVPAAAPPTPPGTSPSGTTITPGSGQIIDEVLGVWTIAPDTRILLNGVHHAGGYAHLLVWWAPTNFVYARNTNYPEATGWWHEPPTSTVPWVPSSDPRTSAPPPPPPPVNPCVAAPLVVTSISWPSNAEGARQLRYTATVAGVVTTITKVEVLWSPQRLVVTDARGCTATRQ